LTRITQQDADKLLRYLPDFERPGREFDEGLGGGEPTGDGFTAYYYRYPGEVEAFFALVEDEPWGLRGYRPHKARTLIEDRDSIESASLDQLRVMLTYCARGERFCDGHWRVMLERGIVQRLLRRLQALRPDLPA